MEVEGEKGEEKVDGRMMKMAAGQSKCLEIPIEGSLEIHIVRKRLRNL